MTAESDEHLKEYIAGLVKERRNPAADRRAIDAELQRVSRPATPPHKRAQRRPRKAPETR